MTPPAGEIWRRAALLGSVWAAVEIVFGSFLHNIRFPFAGSLLASLGVCILVAGVRIWNIRGLVWRTGIICALMKSVSPSAVVIGPMLGIIAEAFVLEVFLRLFRSHPVGLVIGGGFAAAVPLLQKILGLVIVYGIDAARLYVALHEYLVRELSIESLRPLDLIGALVGLSGLLGVVMALAGVVVARATLRIDPGTTGIPSGDSAFDFQTIGPGQKFSVLALSGHFVALVVGFLAITELPLWTSLLPITAYAAASILRYGRVARRFARPRLWIEFALITTMAGLLLDGLRSPNAGWSWNGVLIGLRMTLRAVLVIVAFSSISVELRNPKVIRWFLRRGLGRLQSALGVAFQALPRIMEAFVHQRRLLFHPFQTMSHILASTVEWVDRLDREATARRHTFVITGNQGTGKTVFLMRLLAAIKRSGWTAGGILSPAVNNGGLREGYDVRDIRTGLSVPLCRADGSSTGITSGPYSFSPAGIAFGTESLEARSLAGMDVVCIDEIGLLELDGKGWAPATRELLKHLDAPLVLVVRSSLLERLPTFLDRQPEAYWHPSTTTDREAFDQLRAVLD